MIFFSSFPDRKHSKYFKLSGRQGLSPRVIKTFHSVDNQSAASSFQAKILPGGPSIQSVSARRFVGSLKCFSSQNNSQNSGLSTPLFIEINKKIEEFVPVSSFSFCTKKAPWLRIVRRRGPAGSFK